MNVGDLMWSMHNPQCMRTVENIEKWVTKGEYSTKHVPLFNFIPMVRVVIDILHLFLRISDQLTELLINELKGLDAIAKTNVVRGNR